MTNYRSGPQQTIMDPKMTTKDHNRVGFDYSGPIVDVLAYFWTFYSISEPVDLLQ